MTFLPFLLNRSKLPICSYYFFLFWPVTLQTLKGSSTAPNKASQLLSCLFCLTCRGYQYAHTIFFSFGLYHLNQLKKEKKSIHACILIKKISKKKKKSIYACILINKISKKKKSTIFFYFGLKHFKHLMPHQQLYSHPTNTSQ